MLIKNQLEAVLKAALLGLDLYFMLQSSVTALFAAILLNVFNWSKCWELAYSPHWVFNNGCRGGYNRFYDQYSNFEF